MSQKTPIEDYKLVDKTDGEFISFDTGLRREFKVVYRLGVVYAVSHNTRDNQRVSSALTPDQAEAYATLLLYAAKQARKGNYAERRRVSGRWAY